MDDAAPFLAGVGVALEEGDFKRAQSDAARAGSVVASQSASDASGQRRHSARLTAGCRICPSTLTDSPTQTS